MTTRITMMLVLAAASTVNAGCACMSGRTSCGSGGCDVGDASCGLPEASCSFPDASCGLPEASCSIPDASCGLPADACDSCVTTVGCGTPVMGIRRFPLLKRICDAFHGRSNYYSDYNSEAYWSEWHNDPPSDGQLYSPQASTEGYSSTARRRTRLSKQGVNFGDELRFAEQGSGTSHR